MNDAWRHGTRRVFYNWNDVRRRLLRKVRKIACSVSMIYTPRSLAMNELPLLTMWNFRFSSFSLSLAPQHVAAKVCVFFLTRIRSVWIKTKKKKNQRKTFFGSWASWVSRKWQGEEGMKIYRACDNARGGDNVSRENCKKKKKWRKSLKFPLERTL